MELSPASDKSKMDEVDVCTPVENLKRLCQEITPNSPTPLTDTKLPLVTNEVNVSPMYFGVLNFEYKAYIE